MPYNAVRLLGYSGRRMTVMIGFDAGQHGGDSLTPQQVTPVDIKLSLKKQTLTID